jgi:C4-dicarboxylate-specific signal transduction histidine kinase
VESLMTFSYQGTPALQDSNINEIIDNTLLFLNTKITSELEIEKEYRFKDKIWLYPNKIHQVILNIIDNALYEVNRIKRKSKKIKISTNKEKESLIIKLYNNGPKIPAANLCKIFDPFYTTKDPGTGTGLGLSISYSLIKEHKGKLSVANVTNGVEFKIEIPMTLHKK